MPYSHLNPNRLSNDRSLFAVEYCGNCHGTCHGCALSDSQLSSKEPFNNIDDIDVNIAPYLRYLDENRVKNIAIEFGRGNHLTLDSKYIDDIINFAENLFYSYSFEHINIEVSTSLIGNFNNQVDVAKRLIDEEQRFDGKINFKFVVVANTSIDNGNYWNKIRSFLKITESHREFHIIEEAKKMGVDVSSMDTPEIDGCGDIIILNISPIKVPDIHLIYRHITRLKSPVNLSWWFNDGIKSSITEEDISKVEKFLYQFVSYPTFSEIDCSFSESIVRFLEERRSFQKDSLPTMIQSSMEKYSIFIDHDGKVLPAFFTPFGLVEAGRVSCVAKDSFYEDLDHARDVHIQNLIKAAASSTACTKCIVRDVCVYTGIINIGMMNIANLKETGKKFKGCPAGVKSSIRHLTSKKK